MKQMNINFLSLILLHLVFKCVGNLAHGLARGEELTSLSLFLVLPSISWPARSAYHLRSLGAQSHL